MKIIQSASATLKQRAIGWAQAVYYPRELTQEAARFIAEGDEHFAVDASATTSAYEIAARHQVQAFDVAHGTNFAQQRARAARNDRA